MLESSQARVEKLSGREDKISLMRSFSRMNQNDFLHPIPTMLGEMEKSGCEWSG